jgi:hypothetical protein
LDFLLFEEFRREGFDMGGIAGGGSNVARGIERDVVVFEDDEDDSLNGRFVGVAFELAQNGGLGVVKLDLNGDVSGQEVRPVFGAYPGFAGVGPSKTFEFLLNEVLERGFVWAGDASASEGVGDGGCHAGGWLVVVMRRIWAFCWKSAVAGLPSVWRTSGMGSIPFVEVWF